MAKAQVMVPSYGDVENQETSGWDQKNSTVNPNKRKASWLRTIMWMLSMILLVNVGMGVLFFILYHYGIIH